MQAQEQLVKAINLEIWVQEIKTTTEICEQTAEWQHFTKIRKQA